MHVSILGVVCTVTVVATHPQMATQTAGDSEGKDLRQERSLDAGLSGEQIALLMAEVTGLKKAVVERQNEMAKMIKENTRTPAFFPSPVTVRFHRRCFRAGPGCTARSGTREYGRDKRDAAVHSLQKAAEMLERRMKLIKMADHSEHGWAVIAEYESDELVVDSDDEKRIHVSKQGGERSGKEVV